MQKLIPVEEAKALMNEARNWSVWRWMMEKGKVRRAADKANEALDDLEKKVKAAWPEDLRKAYRELQTSSSSSSNPRAKNRREKAKQETSGIDAETKLALERLSEADDKAAEARVDAEETFEAAERQLSTSKAREGTQKAIDSWDLHLKAIRKAEALARRA